MLKGIDPLLGPELLGILRAMGHGDEIVVADANFPAVSLGAPGRVVRADGVDAVRMVKAIAAILPLDDYVPNAAFRMSVVNKPDEIPPITQEFATVLKAAGYHGGIGGIERQAFYTRAKSAYAIVATGEVRTYGNLILKKGTIHS